MPESFFSSIEYEKRAKAPINNELAEKFQKFATDPDFCAIMGKDLQGLPPAMVLTCGIDVLRDEGYMYVKRLQSFDVPARWFHYDNGKIKNQISEKYANLFFPFLLPNLII